MKGDGETDPFTMIIPVNSPGELSVKQAKANTLRNGVDFTKLLITKFLEIPNVSYAHKLLGYTPNPTIYLYNKLIQAYYSHGPQKQCLVLYSETQLKGLLPDPCTFTFLFAAAATFAAPFHGQMLHAHFLKWGFEFDIYAVTALLDMYAKLGLMDSARSLFNWMKIKDVPTWNSLIAGYAKNGDMEEALSLFSKMHIRNVRSWTAMISGYSQNGKYADALKMYMEMEKEKGVRPNEVTIASVLPACANLGAWEVGQRIEDYARMNGYFENMFVCNAILDMYARCGGIDSAMRVFNEIGSRRNLCTWNTIIMGLAVHGKCKEALNLFNQMLDEGTSPDDVTFVGAILACTHGGMVAKGRELFNVMQSGYSLTPKLEHYGCMVDLLGRAGELKEAYRLIQGMPMRPDSVVWGTMLGACSFHVNVELAEKAAERLFKLEPWNPGNYVILSNIYAKARRWDGVAKLRKLMKGSQITKAAGHSFIEEGGKIHKFIVDDKSHPKSGQVYAILDDVYEKMKLRGHASQIYYLAEEQCTMDTI